MTKERSKELKPLGNEKSYSSDFFDELCKKINLRDPATKSNLRRSIILAAQAYIRNYAEVKRQLSAHEIKKELNKTVGYIDKAAESLIKIYASGNYGEEIISSLHHTISNKYPSLNSLLEKIRREDAPFMTVTSPIQSLALLEALAEGIEHALENYTLPKTTAKSTALNQWLMILSADLEPIIGRKLEQSRYHKTDKGGEYISKKEMNDSELLQFIIAPLDPNVTISQIETALKETRKERHEAPWDDYFPKF